jgi:hypothetical protein
MLLQEKSDTDAKRAAASAAPQENALTVLKKPLLAKNSPFLIYKYRLLTPKRRAFPTKKRPPFFARLVLIIQQKGQKV